MPEITSRLTAALSDRYRIERELGQGGMATVYLAEDVKHKRKVALKVLKPELAAVLGAERFVQEITTTASLQHPHILPLFDSGEADSFLYYVMPYIEGETLREKLDREKQLGIEEAVCITTEVADALDCAHGQNVIHRDIKPENILLHNGRPMVADFGIALAVSAAAGGRMTETGLSLGTPHYMSPEQATAEKDLTGRSDVYSLGAVLYEMLTGDPPHIGGTAQQIIMKIVTEEVPPVTKARKTVPPNVAAATAKALAKLPADRFGSAAEFAEAVANPAFTAGGLAADGATVRAGGRSARTIGLAAVAGVAIALAAWGWLRVPRANSVVSWLDLQLPDTAPMRLASGAVGWNYRALAMSRDGRRIAYIAELPGGSTRLYARSIETPTFRALSSTDGAILVEFSPDGDWLAFVADQKLRKVPFAGGDATTLAEVNVEGYDFAGMAWSTLGVIVASSGNGLVTYDVVTGARSATAAACSEIRLPCWLPDPLPDGEWVLVSSYEDVAIASLRTGERRTLVDSLFEPQGRLLPSGDIAFFQRPGELFVLPFDVKTRERRGTPIPVLEGIRQSEQGQYAVAANGTLLYASGHHHLRSRLTWVDRSGQEFPLELEPETHGAFSLSPDGRFVAAALYGKQGQVWLYDLVRQTKNRLTTQGFVYTSAEQGQTHEVFAQRYPPTDERWKVSVGGGANPRWARDGQRLYYTDPRTGGIFEVALKDGPNRPGLPKLLLPGPFQYTYGFGMSVAPDDQRFLVLKAEDPRTSASSLRWVENWMERVRTVSARAND